MVFWVAQLAYKIRKCSLKSFTVLQILDRKLNFHQFYKLASWISFAINFSLIKILRKCIGLDFHDVLQSCLNVSSPIESPIDRSRFALNICCPRNADSIFEMFRMLVVNSFYEHIFRKHVFITWYCIKRTISTSEIKLMTR